MREHAGNDKTRLAMTIIGDKCMRSMSVPSDETDSESSTEAAMAGGGGLSATDSMSVSDTSLW